MNHKRHWGRALIPLSIVLSSFLLISCASQKKPVVSPAPDQAGVSQDQPGPKRMESVVANRVNMRMLPSVDSKTVRVLHKNEPVEVKEQWRYWAKVVAGDGMQGWIHGPGNLSGFPEPSKIKGNPLAKPPWIKDGNPSASSSDPNQKFHEMSDQRAQLSSGSAPESSENAETFDISGSSSTLSSGNDISGKNGAAHNQARKKGSADKELIFLEVVPSRETLSEEKDKAPARSDALDHPGDFGAKGNALGVRQERPSRGGDSSKESSVSNERSEKRQIIEGKGVQKTSATKTLIARGNAREGLVKVRSAPLATATVIWEVQPGTRLISHGKEGKWYRVESVGGAGYLHEESVQEVAD